MTNYVTLNVTSYNTDGVLVTHVAVDPLALRLRLDGIFELLGASLYTPGTLPSLANKNKGIIYDFTTLLCESSLSQSYLKL